MPICTRSIVNDARDFLREISMISCSVPLLPYQVPIRKMCTKISYVRPVPYIHVDAIISDRFWFFLKTSLWILNYR